MTDIKINNQLLSRRLHKVIPGGAHTYSRGDDQFPSNAPALLERGAGAYVWDTDGNKFLDYGMALRSVTLGYAHPHVNTAAVEEIKKGVSLTRASMTELRAAERLCEVITSVEMVKFAKNGSNATTAAIKIARAYTGRRFVCVPRQQPFFSFDDWFIGSTVIKRGTLTEHNTNTLFFDYNDIDSLRVLFETHPGEIAAVMLEPSTHIVPCNAEGCTDSWPAAPCSSCPNNEANFLYQVRSVAHEYGALFILDEMISGFRWHLKGAQYFFGIEPDLATFGKAMANGFALAAVGGKAKYMEVGSIKKVGMERTFLLSSTHGGEMSALGAFLAAVEICEQQNVPSHLWQYGTRLRDGITALAASRGLADFIELEGPSVALNYTTRNASGQPCPIMRTIFVQEMMREGVMMPWISVSLAHGDEELDLTMKAVATAMDVYAHALQGNPADYLQGEAVKPVFRTHN